RALRAACWLGLSAALIAGGCAWEGGLPWRKVEGPAVPQGPALTGIQPDPAAEHEAAQRAASRELADKLTEAEQEKARLTARLRQVETQLAEKDRALSQANRDLQASADEVARTRGELQRWNQEMANLRAKMNATEKENVATLQAITKALEQMADRNRPPVPPKQP